MTDANHRFETIVCHERAVSRVIGAMHERLEDQFSLTDMAEVAIMSPFHFNRTFRQFTGVPPCQVLGALRLDAARRLLLTTNTAVTDVCFSVGYNSLGTFTRRFTALLGLSPGRLRTLAAGSHPITPSRIPQSTVVSADRVVLCGNVSGPPLFRGPVFVGLFRTAIPQDQPVACSVLQGPGRFSITGMPDGEYHLFALGIPSATDVRQYLVYDMALRGGGQVIRVTGGAATGNPDVELHEARITDPPILITLPILLARARPRSSRHLPGIASRVSA